MPPRKLDNYLFSYRKRSGLTQGEVAFVLRCGDRRHVSRYEKRVHIPSLATALACEAVFGVPVSKLFAGLRGRAGKEVGKQLLVLKSELEARSGKPREARRTACSSCFCGRIS
jgi:transcriptional regulator with XRE-family HTH domain